MERTAKAIDLGSLSSYSICNETSAAKVSCSVVEEAIVQSTYGAKVEERLNVDLRTYMGNTSVAFVIEDFDSPVCNYLQAAGHRIFGPTVILECAQLNLPLPLKSRPLYCQSMQGVVICFSGLNDKARIAYLVQLIHNMGGSVRKDFTSSCTHVVSNTTQKEKYRLAVGMGRPVMSENWVFKCWERRNILFSSALADDLVSLKLKPFHCLIIYFHGYPKLETTHMQEQAKYNGASISEVAENCTHVVIDPSWFHSNLSLPFELPKDAHLVTGEWFWMSIQLNVCANEKMYQVFEQQQNSNRLLKPSNATSPQCATNRNKSRRSSFFGKRSNVGADNRLSVSQGSFLDASGDASSILADHLISAEDVENFIKTPKRCMSKRQQVCIELLQTENNYFQMLRTIVKVFKEPLEKPDLIGGEILDSTELKLIFGRIQPIYDVHSKINHDLANLIMHWSENRCIGDVWLKYEEDLLKSYPPFVNFFEKTKETLNECDRSKPRFHAFLKVCQTKPECQRQSLQELLIRPVQRLPSVILLLSDLLKRTEKLNPDYNSLQRAIDTLKEVLTYINKEKGKTQEQLKLFEIVNVIKNCPPHLLSSQRILISSAEVTELSNGLTRKGTRLTFYVFNDCLEIVAVTGRIDFEVQEYDVLTCHNESDLGRTVFKAINLFRRAQSLTRKLSRNISKSNSLQRAVSQVALAAWNGTLRSISRTNLRQHAEEYHRTHSRMSTLTSPS